MRYGKTLAEMEEFATLVAGKPGLALEPDLAKVRAAIVKRLDYGPERDMPFMAPDGVVYESGGSRTYPGDHPYTKQKTILDQLCHEDPVLQERIERALGMYHADGGAKAMTWFGRWLARRLAKV